MTERATIVTKSHDRVTCTDGGLPDWPEDALRLAELRGAFALAFVDGRGHLHLARDAMGHRSLYWARSPDGDRIFFSHRLADLVTALPSRRLCMPALATYLSTAYVPGEHTLVEGVYAVPPGVELVFERDTARPRRVPFFSLPATPSEYATESVLRETLRETLDDSVRRLGASEEATALGATLSGGIDSSLVVALLAKHGPVVAHSISFGPEHRDELYWSGMVARHVGATHRVVMVRPGDVVEKLDTTVAALSEPNGDPLTVPNTMLFEAARGAGLSSLWNGEGGDPCFGGPKNAPLLLSEVYGEGDTSWPRERAYLRAHQKFWDELAELLCPEVCADIHEGALESLVTPWFEDSRWPSFLDRLMAINVAWKGAGHILPKVEHLGLRVGVIPRSPLFDQEVVSLAFRIPSRLKRSGTVEKYLLKSAVADLLPSDILERPKSGMLVPVEAWFSGPLAAFARERILDGLGSRGLFRRPYLERLVAGGKGLGLRPRRGVKIWLLLTLESWLRGVFDAPVSEPSRAQVWGCA